MKKTHEQQLNQANGFAKELMDKISEGMEQATKLKELLIKPLETKTISINGVNCVVQRYEDNVRIILASKEDVLDYYNNIGLVKKECWYKKLKWSK